jgi:hypothetical protein
MFRIGSLSKGYLLIRERFLVLDQYRLKILSLGLQCLLSIRARASDSRIIFFGPAVPSSYSSLGFGPSNYLLQASSAFKLFELGLRSLELSSSGQQCLQVIRAWASVPRIIFFGPAVPSDYSSLGSSPSNHLLRASSAFALFEFGLRSLESLFRAINALRSKYPNFGGNIPVWMPYVKYEGKSTVCNTRWPGIHIKHALPRNFPYLRYEVCTDGRIGCLTMNWASTW